MLVLLSAAKARSVPDGRILQTHISVPEMWGTRFSGFGQMWATRPGCSEEDRCRKCAHHVATGHAVPCDFDHGSPRGDCSVHVTEKRFLSGRAACVSYVSCDSFS